MLFKISFCYKILIRFKCCAFYSVVFTLFFSTVSAQDTLLNKYGLWVINDTATFNKTTSKNTTKMMVDIRKAIPAIMLDLRYAGTGNFMHSTLYPPIKTTYLRRSATDALVKVEEALKKQKLGIKIWDGYRPYAVTEKMWEPIKDDRYAADPKFGSGHNRGVAVDVTIINLRTKKELNMGTGFDNFSDTAHIDFKNLPAAVLANRQLLKSVMEQYGFKALDTEWWHFYLPDTKKYELLNLSFKDLKKINTPNNLIK